MCGASAMLALTAVQGIQQYNATQQQTAAQVNMYNNQAKVAEQNARISAAKQSQIADQYASQQQKLNDRMRLAAGQTAAQAGASNLQLAGSPLDLLASGYQAHIDDTNQLLANQRNDVRSEYMNQINYENAASAYHSSAANAKTQGKNALMGTILNTAASLYGIGRSYRGADSVTSKTGGDYVYGTYPNYQTGGSAWGYPQANTTFGIFGSGANLGQYAKTFNYSNNLGIYSNFVNNPYLKNTGYNSPFNKKVGG